MKTTKPTITIEMISTKKLVRHPQNRQPKPERVEELATSIEADGVRTPLVVRPFGDGVFQIICGEHRWLAAKSAGLMMVPCQVRDLDDKAALELILLDNLERVDFSPMEESDAVRALVAAGVDFHELARRTHRSEDWVQLRFALGELPPRMREAVDARRVALEAAAAVLRVPAEDRERAVQLVLEPAMQPEPLAAKQAAAVIEAEILRPLRARADWVSAKAKLLAAWKRSLAPMERVGGRALEVSVGDWEWKFSGPGDWMDVHDFFQNTSEICPEESLDAGALAARVGAPVVVVPRKFFRYFTGLDKAADLPESVAVVSRSVLLEADAQHAQPWLSAQGAGAKMTRADWLDRNRDLVRKIREEVVAAYVGGELPVSPLFPDIGDAAFRLAMETVTSVELDTGFVYEALDIQAPEVDDLWEQARVFEFPNYSTPGDWPLCLMLWGELLTVSLHSLDESGKLTGQAKANTLIMLEALDGQIDADILPTLRSVAG